MIHLGRCRKASDSHRGLNFEGPRNIEIKKAENTLGELYVHQRLEEDRGFRNRERNAWKTCKRGM